MGGMSAQVIAKANPKEINEKALAGVKKDKERELNQGNDGALSLKQGVSAWWLFADAVSDSFIFCALQRTFKCSGISACSFQVLDL